MQDPYAQCYIAGRYDSYEDDVDLEKIAERVLSGSATIRDACMAAAKPAIEKEMDPAAKILWLKDNVDEIKEMGGDTEKALRLYQQGRIDGLAHQLETDVLILIEDTDDEEDDEEDVVEKTNGADDDDEEEDDEDEDEDEEEDE
jgi:hypothetical protein